MLREENWQAILNRDRTYDHLIVYAVVSTKIYCLPSCPARKPKRVNVLIFNTSVEAEQAGFRPCKRCLPEQHLPKQPHIELVEQICREIDQRISEKLTLSQLATQFNLSSAYLQRTFKSIVGITPRQYTEVSRLARFKLELTQEDNVAQAVYQAGYNSSSSLYENISSKLGMTPKIYQQQGKTIQITYTVVDCSLGYLLVATTDKGICSVKLGDRPKELIKILTDEFQQATIIRDDQNHQDWIKKILNLITGTESDPDLPLDIRGTAFQQQVWQALQKIPYGAIRTYTDIAQDLGKPKAVRAIANACGANPVALIIPCHRVVRNDGSLGGYRWGIERKQKLIEQENLKLINNTPSSKLRLSKPNVHDHTILR
jgi:AraC family transcriptional regulator, regulatory protein of adaptative response / methylated-DNA-[protein]-cysteine methyltransferase